MGCPPTVRARARVNLPTSVTVTSLDALLSGISLALFVLLATLGLRDGGRLPQCRALAALAISVSAQAVASLPLASMLPLPLYAAIRLVGAPNVGLLWWFCLVLLRDDFRPKLLAFGGLTALSLAPLAYLVSDLGVDIPALSTINAYGSLAPLLMVGHVGWVAMSERAADLLEPRRRARVWIVSACLLALVVSLATEEMADGQLASVLRNGLVGVPVAGVLVLWLTRLRTEHLQFIERPETAPAFTSEVDTALPVDVLPLSAFPRGVHTIDPRDIALHRRLVQALETERCYLTPGLTIAELAEQLRTPVQTLRALIHAASGHRNFASLLNQHRVAHAKQLLGDPEMARDTVLSIALTSGFASLATFNRVFRDLEGSTPTEFRATALASQVQRRS